MVSQVKKEILNLVFRQRLAKGERLFSIDELARFLSVSTTTVREAIRSLEQLHVLEVKQGKGIYLAIDPRSLGKNIAQLKSATEMAQESGIHLETFRWRVEEIEADQDLAEKLKVHPGTSLVFLARVRGFEGEMAVYLEDILTKELVADFTPSDWQGSLFNALEKRGIFITHSLAQIIPYFPEEHFAKEIGLTELVPLLVLEHLHFDATGRVVAFSKDYYNSKYFRFEVVRKRI